MQGGQCLLCRVCCGERARATGTFVTRASTAPPPNRRDQSLRPIRNARGLELFLDVQKTGDQIL
eukprot:3354306-Pleurochrysis_carterae.AAC.1